MKDMARPRKTIATTVGFDVKALKEITSKMSDNELGAWIRKAVLDCLNGCTAQDTDPFIKASYESARSKMLARQNIDAQKYQNNLARQGKTPQEPTADSLAASANGAYNTPTRESETRGPQTDNNLAESATRTSEAIKALADASTREGEDERDHRGNTGILESSTSAKTLSEAREAQARESLPAGERGKRSRAISRPVDAPAGSPVEATPAKRPYGSCGHVMLTNEEGAHLREIYGENLAIAIDILDGYLENNPKALKKYKNHAAVLRKGNWVYNKILEMKDKELRLNNAKKQGDRRSFAQKDRDDRSNWLTHSMFELPEAANG